jgi:ribose 5-phosphate isomerase B
MATIAIASDHAGVALKAELLAELKQLGHEGLDLGPNGPASVDYPDYAVKVTDAITSGKAASGVLICGTGLGMSIAANKIDGIRAVLCHTEFEARMSRVHNDANVLCLGARVIGGSLALELLKAFLSTSFEAGGRHTARVEKLKALETRR